MKDLCPGLAHPWVSAKGKQQQTKKTVKQNPKLKTLSFQSVPTSGAPPPHQVRDHHLLLRRPDIDVNTPPQFTAE